MALDRTHISVGPAPPGFDDFAGVLALVQHAFAGHAGRIDPPSSSTRDTPEALRALAGEGTLFLATAADGQLVGCVFGRPVDDAFYLCKLAVDPAHRCRGIARALLERLIAHASDAGFARVTLGVRLTLHQNIALFERLGFVKTGETCHPGFTAPTSQDMALELSRDAPVSAGTSSSRRQRQS